MIYLYNVWCGGIEANQYPMEFDKAKKMAEELRDEGYEDVVIEPYDPIANLENIIPKVEK